VTPGRAVSADFCAVDLSPGSVKGSRRPAAQPAVPRARLAVPAAGVPAVLPEALSPPLATLAARLTASPEDWLCEIKFGIERRR